MSIVLQVGQLLQQLAMADDDGDPRRRSSLAKFDKVRGRPGSKYTNHMMILVFNGTILRLTLQSCVAAFLDVVIGGRAVETPPMSSMNLLEGLSRTVFYMTHGQLLTLVSC